MHSITELHRTLNTLTGVINLVGESKLGYHFGTANEFDSSTPTWDEKPFADAVTSMKGEVSYEQHRKFTF
jgi:hypothetical protein